MRWRPEYNRKTRRAALTTREGRTDREDHINEVLVKWASGMMEDQFGPGRAFTANASRSQK